MLIGTSFMSYIVNFGRLGAAGLTTVVTLGGTAAAAVRPANRA